MLIFCCFVVIGLIGFVLGHYCGFASAMDKKQ